MEPDHNHERQQAHALLDMLPVDKLNALRGPRSGDSRRRCEKAQASVNRVRLRCGDYRVFFDLEGESSMEVIAVRNRREAYR